VDVTRPAGDVIRGVLRVEAGGSFTGTEINVTKEGIMYRALQGTGVPVPRVLGLAPGGTALLLERLPGRGDLGDTDDEKRATLVDFVDVIADLHSVNVGALDLPGFPRPRTAEDHARLDLQVWGRLANERVDRLDPLARYAAGYLLAHPPDEVSRTVVVQGDTGPGNFVADRGKVTGLCDMEFSHLGDPMDDIAWMLSRAFGAGPDPQPFLDRYTRRSGIPIDWRSVAYYSMAVQYRCVVTTSLAVSRGGGARGWPPYLLVTERYILGLADALSRALGIREPDPGDVPELPETPRGPWFDALMTATRTAVRALPDPALAEETRNHQILIHYLRAYDQMGSCIDELNRRDMQQSIGIGDEGPDLGDCAEKAGTGGDEATLRFLLRRTWRNRLLWRTLLDRSRRSAAAVARSD
jgi:aminoglycoside phosphotransferase (APT) family kinase protein